MLSIFLLKIFIFISYNFVFFFSLPSRFNFFYHLVLFFSYCTYFTIFVFLFQMNLQPIVETAVSLGSVERLQSNRAEVVYPSFSLLLFIHFFNLFTFIFYFLLTFFSLYFFLLYIWMRQGCKGILHDKISENQFVTTIEKINK